MRKHEFSYKSSKPLADACDKSRKIQDPRTWFARARRAMLHVRDIALLCALR